MDKIKYAMLTEVPGRWKADIIESFLEADGIDVVLVQEAISHLTHPTSFAPVGIYVPKSSVRQARGLLKSFYEARDNSKEKLVMANKKKIEERLEAERKARQTRYIQITGVGIALLVIAFGFWLFANQAGAKSKQYDAYPPMTIDATKQYFAQFVMLKGGEFTVELYPDKAPLAVNSFVFLAREGYFDGVTFHRVIEGFMAQGGDPTGTGRGGPGYEFANEDSDLTFDKAGVVAMGNRGRDTNGSQFFITFVPYPGLNGNYTIFGQVVEGMDVVNAITRRDPDTNPNFAGDVIESVTITEK